MKTNLGDPVPDDQSVDGQFYPDHLQRLHSIWWHKIPDTDQQNQKSIRSGQPLRTGGIEFISHPT